MANPALSAKNSDLQTFLQEYDRKRTPRYATSSGMTALGGAMSNKDPKARFAIGSRLLDDGADPRTVTTGGDSPLHSLVSQFTLTPDDAVLLKRLLDGGADVNLPDSKHKAPLAILFNNYSAPDADAEPLYDVLFARPDLDLGAPASRQHTVRELLALTPDYKPEFQRRARAYDEGATA